MMQTADRERERERAVGECPGSRAVAAAAAAMSPPGLLPTYQRFASGGATTTPARRSFRPREKYLLALVSLTFCAVCFGAFFFLPEFRGAGEGSSAGGVYRVYRRMQKAGPELLIPAPPLQNELGDAPDLVRHNDREGPDPHQRLDRDRLLAKIEREEPPLERPQPQSRDPSQPRGPPSERPLLEAPPEETATVPPAPLAPADAYPITRGGEDPDPTARERRDKVKQVGKHSQLIPSPSPWKRIAPVPLALPPL